MGFRFRLQRVLQLAEVEEEVARSAYEKQIDLLQEYQASLSRIEEERRSMAADLARPQGRTVGELRAAEARVLALDRRGERERQRVEEQRRRADEARHTLRHQWAEREKFTRLRAKLLQQHRLRQERATQLELDDLVASRHGRSPAERR